MDASSKLAQELIAGVHNFHSYKADIFPLLGIQIHVLDFAGSLLVCRAYRQANTSRKLWVEVMVSCFIMQFG